jgi:hypothetical protein
MPSRGSPRGDPSGGHAGALYWAWCIGPTGVREQGISTQGFPRNLRDPAVPDPQNCGVELPHPKAPGSSTGVGLKGRDEDRRKGWYRQAKETKCGETVGRKSECLIVPLIQGNSNRGNPEEGRGHLSWNRWRETCRVHRNSETCQRDDNE